METNLTTISQQQERQLAAIQHSKNLVDLIISNNQIELAEVTSNLMPDGCPNFEPIRELPTIKSLCEQMEDGRKKMRMVLFQMVKNISESINVVRNLTEDQMIEIASFLLDECGDFRLEDYQMMFSLAKRNKLVKFRDRIDITVISEMLDEYWMLRKKEGDRIREEKIDLAATKRLEQKQKMIGTSKIIELPPDWFSKELKRLQDAADEQRDKEWKAYIGRREQRKEEFKRQMADAYGFSMEQMEQLTSPTNTENVVVKTYPSKINETIDDTP